VRVSARWIWLLLAAGCDMPAATPPRDRGDAGLQFASDDLSRADDLAAPFWPMHDLSMPAQPSDMMASLRGDGGGGSGCIKVNELLTASKSRSGTQLNGDEFVELFNVCPGAQSLSGWKLVYRSAGNNGSPSTGDIVLVRNLVQTLRGGDFMVWGGPQYTGAKEGVLGSGLSDSGGGVAVIDTTNQIVDSVAYGPVVASHNFIEGSGPAPLPPVSQVPGSSIARLPDGHDRDDNAADFTVSTTPTPHASNR
jgi:hypothetical protein